MQHDVAGEPMKSLKWTRRTTAKIADELGSIGIQVSPRTVARLLEKMDYSLRVNHKKLSSGSKADSQKRDAQFAKIAEIRERCAAEGIPLISADAKKKENVGRFKNDGTCWAREPTEVYDHDFPSDAIGRAIPYGVYDLCANRGTVFIGTTYDTPDFAVDCVEKWWRTEGRKRYPDKNEMVILVDCGGSNGYRCRAWKYGLQIRLSDRHGLRVRVAHYPTGASKWNPIEHRLFSQISRNWEGRPLDSYEAISKYISTTKTSTGLRVRAHMVRRRYKRGVKITDAQMAQLCLEKDDSLPEWNYTLSPST
jgi:hypothetical protein